MSSVTIITLLFPSIFICALTSYFFILFSDITCSFSSRGKKGLYAFCNLNLFCMFFCYVLPHFLSLISFFKTVKGIATVSSFSNSSINSTARSQKKNISIVSSWFFVFCNIYSKFFSISTEQQYNELQKATESYRKL